MSRTMTTTGNAARRNIRAISELEREALAKRSVAERISDAVNHYAGTMRFVLVHVIWFTGWIIWNSLHALHLPVFDPYPFELLTLVVSLEAIFLSLFILMSQNRLQRQADARSHLDLQINLLAEFETTKMLSMLQSLCAHFGLEEAKDKEVQELKTRTRPDMLLREIKESLPEGC